MWSASPGWQPSHKSCMQHRHHQRHRHRYRHRHRHHHRHPHHHHQPLHFEIYIIHKMKVWLTVTNLATDTESNYIYITD